MFLEWLTSSEFATLYANAVPGTFPLSNVPVKVDDPLAATFLSWRNECQSTLISSSGILSTGDPNNDTGVNTASTRLLDGNLSPQEAADLVQNDLSKWYKPQQGR